MAHRTIFPGGSIAADSSLNGLTKPDLQGGKANPVDKKKAQSQGLRLNPPKEEVLEETSDWHPTCSHYASALRTTASTFCCYAKKHIPNRETEKRRGHS
jgi:hypothetical protein